MVTQVRVQGRSADRQWVQVGLSASFATTGWISTTVLGSCAAAPSAGGSAATPATSSSAVGASNGLCPKFYEVWEGRLFWLFG